ncbi:MAG TPA: AraC family transcriptional regulator ligand-binding domain-containing protein [Polyangiales bacterium]|nr:AraC family transcriptional regulator ligand-binding domain-containing protein [Polyangiales bacterium]
MAIGSVYRPFLQLARAAGVDVEAELARFGIREQDLSESRLPPAHGRALVLRIAAVCGIPELGLEAAKRAQLTDLDLLGYMARNAEHALAAIETMARYSALLGDTAACELSFDAGQVVVRFGLMGGQFMLPDGADYAALVFCRMIAELTGGRARPLEVQLTRPRPRRPRVYREHFGVMPVFGAECMVLRFDEAALRSPLATRDPRLHRILEDQAVANVVALPLAADLLTRVRAQIRKALESKGGDIRHVAASCGMSERTLRRQLEAAGSSFRVLVDDVRRQRALELIDEGRTRIGELAEGTGYTDLSAFARAFRRWTGLAPLRYLALHRAGDLHRQAGE